MKVEKYWPIPFGLIVGSLINLYLNTYFLRSAPETEFGLRNVEPISILELGFNFILYPLTIIFLIYLINDLKRKDFWGVVMYSMIVSLMWGVMMIGSAFFGVCLMYLAEEDFSHNIFTNQCVYGVSGECGYDEPWNYKKGCSTTEDKIEAIKEYGLYNEWVNRCEDWCRAGQKKVYCDPVENAPYFDINQVAMSCEELTTCEKIKCVGV